MARDGEVKQRQHFCHHGDTICHPKSGYVTTKLPYRCNNNAIFSDRAIFMFSCRLRMPVTLIWLRRSLGSSCQTGKMAALLNSFTGTDNYSWTPALCALFVCVFVRGHDPHTAQRTTPHCSAHERMTDHETQSRLICICRMERYIITYTS